MTNAIRIHEVGGPDVLRWDTVEVGEPAPGQLRIRQQAVGVNFIDVYHRTGLYQQPLPFTPGVEGAGTVDAVGEGVSDFSVGDRVAYAGPIGGYAEERLLDADRAVALPDDIGFDQAAAMMLRGMTVQMLIRELHRVQAGETILVHAADAIRAADALDASATTRGIPMLRRDLTTGVIASEDEVDDPGDRIGSVYRGSAILEDFHPLHGRQRNAVHVHGDGVADETHAVRCQPAAVEQHERAV